MENIIVLGTGHAMVTKCYNTCFALQDGEEYLLVDAGGGNGILKQTDDAGIPFHKIRSAFVSHTHTDHILGMVWVLRQLSSMIEQKRYAGVFSLYCHSEVATALRAIAQFTLPPNMIRHFDDTIVFNIVEDGEIKKVLGYDVSFFDLHSAKLRQFGFTLRLYNKKKLTFLGDEPYNNLCQPYAIGSNWLLSEAFCLYRDKDIFKPYEKHHSTVKDSCELAERMNVDNLVLWHTEDTTLEKRKELYTREGKNYYSGTLYVPDDLDVLPL